MSVLRSLGSQAWLVYVAVISAVSVAYLLGPSFINAGPVFNMIGLSAVAAILIGTRRMPKGRRLPWYLFALGQMLFVTGDVIAYNYPRFFHTALPFPSVADGLYLAVYPALVVGMMLLIRRRRSGSDRAGLIDSLIIAISIGVLSWVYLMAPYAHDGSLGLSTKLISMAYPLMDILVLTVAARLLFGGGKRDFSYLLFMLGVVSLLVTDALYGWLQLHGGYETGNLLDGGWICFYVLLGAAALHPSAGSVAEAVFDHEETLTGGRLALLAFASLAAPAVQAGEYLSGHKIDVPVVAVAGGVLFLLVVARMSGLMKKQKESEARFSNLVRNSSDVVTLIGADTHIRYVSPSVERVLGYRAADLEAMTFSSLLKEEDVARVVSFFLGEDASVPGPRLVEFAIRHKDGRWIEVETMCTNLLADKTVEGVVLNTRDISERKAFERQLEQHAFYDAVTGLANRALFRNRVTHALAQAKRQRRGVAVVFMDLDDFKIVNDSFGHAVGDELLRAVGERLSGCLRDADTAARLGGDEFAMLLEESDDSDGASDVAARILHAFEAPFDVDGREIRVRASLGIAFAGRKQGNAATEELLRNADVAMYMAKSQGKSRVTIYEPTMHKALLQRLELKGDLPRALDEGEFTLHYQPLVTLETGSTHGFEALVRWEHPVRGLVPPLDFISLAEETGLIIPLGNWVLNTACRDAVEFQQRFPQDPPLGMSVNLSARQLQSPSIVAQVKEALETSGLEATTLTLEVTESVMMQNVEVSVLRLNELKALGCHIAIDDFGAGYSSLGYIRQFPVDVFKVDRAFIDRIDQDGDELALTAAIIDLAKVLNLRPFAEGVERPEQLARLLELGCGGAQGYLFSRPAPKAAIVSHLEIERESDAAA